MALPRVDYPTYETILPVSNKKITYRPFLVKEKKLFLLVKESKEVAEIVRIIKQVAQNCIIKPNIDVEDLSTIDLEWLFVMLRARSVGEVVNLDLACQNVVDGTECKAITTVPVNLLNCEVKRNPDHSNKIALTGSVGVVMKYPTFAIAEILDKGLKNPGDVLDLVVDSIDYVYDADNMYFAKDEKREEMVKWFEENIDETQFAKFQNFFATAPEVISKNHFKCQKCGYEEDFDLRGVQDFFT